MRLGGSRSERSWWFPRGGDPLSRLMSRGARRATESIRYIIAGLVLIALIFSFSGFPFGGIILLLAVLYAPYVIVPLASSFDVEKYFYDSRTQFVVAQMSIFGLALLLWINLKSTPAHSSTVWLAFILPLAIVAEYLPTAGVAITAVEIAGIFALLQWHADASAWETLLTPNGMGWLVRALWIALVGFIVHYAVRGERTYGQNLEHLRDSLGSLAGEMGGDGSELKAQDAIARVCVSLLGADGGAFWASTSWKGTLRPLAVVRPDKKGVMRSVSEEERVPVSAAGSAPVLAAQRGIPACFTDLAVSDEVLTDGMVFADCLSPCFTDARFELAAPILSPSTGKVSGAITLAYTGTPVSTAHELQRLADELMSVTSVVGQALRRRIEHEREDVVLDLARRVIEHADGLDAIQEVVRGFTEDLGYEFVLVWVYDSLRGRLRLQHSNLQLKRETKGMSLSDDSGLIYTSLLSGKAREIITGWDDRFDSRVWQAVRSSTTVQAFVPLWVTDRQTNAPQPVGLLQFGRKKRGTVPHEADMVELVSVFRATAVALSNVNLQRRLQAEVGQFAVLSELATDLLTVGQQDRFEIVGKIAQSAREVLEADIIMIYSHDAARGSFEFLTQVGRVKGEKPLRLVNPGSPLLTEIFRGNQPMWVTNVSEEPLLTHAQGEHGGGSSRLSFAYRQRIRSFAGLPLTVGNHPYGVICVNYRQLRSFNEQERRLITVFANLAALALRSSEALAMQQEAALSAAREQYSMQLHNVSSHYVDAISKRADGLALALAAKQLADEQLADGLEIIGGTAHNLQRRLVRVVGELKEQRAPTGSLLSELRKVASISQDLYEFTTHVDIDTALPPVSSEMQTALVSIAQEALINACRHSGCKEAWLRCSCDGDLICLEVEDHGVGLSNDWVSGHGHYGLTHLSVQAARLGGEARFERPQQDQGTLIIVRIPVNLGL